MYYEFFAGPKLLAGDLALEQIASSLQVRNARRPMILTDATLLKIGSVRVLEKALGEGGLEVAGVYSDIPLDSSVKVVNDIAVIYRKVGADSIIALGGGSVIDTAKGVRILISQGGANLLDYVGADGIHKGVSVPLAVVPTTSGTGSEATSVAVIKDEERRVKLEFISEFITPDLAVLDKRMLETMPARITAITGLDALSHAIEAYSSLQGNPVSEVYAASALSLIAGNLEKAIENPKDGDARLKMASAAFLAGVAFSNSMVGLVHAIGHSVGAISRVPHGEAMAILLPHCMRYNKKVNQEYYERMLPFFLGRKEYAGLGDEDGAEVLIKAIESFEKRIASKARVNLCLKDAGVSRADFEKICERTLRDGALIVNRRDAGASDILDILESAY